MKSFLSCLPLYVVTFFIFNAYAIDGRISCRPNLELTEKPNSTQAQSRVYWDTFPTTEVTLKNGKITRSSKDPGRIVSTENIDGRVITTEYVVASGARIVQTDSGPLEVNDSTSVMQISYDGTRLLVTSATTQELTLIDLQRKKIVSRFFVNELKPGTVFRDVQFSPNRRFIGLTTVDAAYVFKINSRDQLVQVEHLFGEMTGITFGDYGRSMYFGRRGKFPVEIYLMNIP